MPPRAEGTRAPPCARIRVWTIRSSKAGASCLTATRTRMPSSRDTRTCRPVVIRRCWPRQPRGTRRRPPRAVAGAGVVGELELEGAGAVTVGVPAVTRPTSVSAAVVVPTRDLLPLAAEAGAAVVEGGERAVRGGNTRAAGGTRTLLGPEDTIGRLAGWDWAGSSISALRRGAWGRRCRDGPVQPAVPVPDGLLELVLRQEERAAE